MRALIFTVALLGCSSAPPRIVHDTVFVHDTVRVAASPKAESSVFTRCMAAARVQARAADEMSPPTDAGREARDANLVSICRTMPDVYLPELR